VKAQRGIVKKWKLTLTTEDLLQILRRITVERKNVKIDFPECDVIFEMKTNTETITVESELLTGG
jgi:hypothetical protein